MSKRQSRRQPQPIPEAREYGEIDGLLFSQLAAVAGRLTTQQQGETGFYNSDRAAGRLFGPGTGPFTRIVKYTHVGALAAARSYRQEYQDLDIDLTNTSVVADITYASDTLQQNPRVSFGGIAHLLTGSRHRLIAVSTSQAQSVNAMLSREGYETGKFADSLGQGSAWMDHLYSAYESGVFTTPRAIVGYDDSMASRLLAKLTGFEAGSEGQT